jgi:putative flippase GtrA
VIRWLKFNAVGMLGSVMQLAVLALLVRLGWNYLLATAVAVETAVLHNYVWHAHWTWRGRSRSLWRFQVSNGLVSLASNLILMRIFTGWAGLPVLWANPLAILCTSLVNFFLSDRWVFFNAAPSAHSRWSPPAIRAEHSRPLV